jgi:hypothetical protein
MLEYNKDEIYKKLRLDGLFSEYLPPCFKLDEKMFKKIPGMDCDVIEPYSFNMSRFNDNDSRRTIFIPEICSYLVLNNYIKENKILEELIDFIDKNSSSFSKIIGEDGDLIKYDEDYLGNTVGGEKVKAQYIDNIVKKLVISAGAKKILKLDIANCYSSFYTHYIPAIIMGYDKAEEAYKKSNQHMNNSSQRTKDDDNYKKYSTLDSIIRKQNKNQTNGLLVGPFISKIVVEALLTRIDIELKDENILFTRYVDDYEVYLFDDNIDSIKSTFIKILKKYGFDLNYEKIEVVDFPYYIVDNFDKIIELCRNDNVDDYDVMKLFNDFFKIEKSGTKGAIRYLLKTLEKEPIHVGNKELFDSYVITIMSNNSRSLTKACSLLIKNGLEHKLKCNHIKQIKNMILNNIEKNFDLEVVWLLYVLIETDNLVKDEDVVKAILTSNNEMAQLMILRKNLTDNTEEVMNKAESWLLNYELFASGDITEIQLIERLTLDKNEEIYIKLKERNLHFCY